MQLWRHAIHYVAEVILEGVARVKSRCSTIGRNAMSAGALWLPSGCPLLISCCCLIAHDHTNVSKVPRHHQVSADIPAASQPTNRHNFDLAHSSMQANSIACCWSVIHIRQCCIGVLAPKRCVAYTHKFRLNTTVEFTQPRFPCSSMIALHMMYCIYHTFT